MRSLAVTIALVAVTIGRLDSQGTGCGDTKYPPVLPPPSTVVDSAHAIADLAAFADPSKPMVFSLVFDRGDSVPRIRALEKNDAAAALALVNYVRHQPPAELWAIRVLIAGGDKPALTLERSRYCPPVSRSGDDPYWIRATITGSISRAGDPTSFPTAPKMTVNPNDVIPVEALISVEGKVVMARVVKSSGKAYDDASAIRNMQQRKFEPAKLDGAPIQGVYRPKGESPRL
jgi:TonB-like protein